jgi:hypothetical protein
MAILLSYKYFQDIAASRRAFPCRNFYQCGRGKGGIPPLGRLGIPPFPMLGIPSPGIPPPLIAWLLIWPGKASIGALLPPRSIPSVAMGPG